MYYIFFLGVYFHRFLYDMSYTGICGTANSVSGPVVTCSFSDA